ncbi:MAG: glucose-phosphatase [Chloroflexota bacterium]|nr:glucose-phosphatase [Chloroflexota bacterium]
MIKVLVWDLAGVLLHGVDGNFESMLAKRLAVSEEAAFMTSRSEVNDRWDLGEMDNETYFRWLLKTLDQPLDKLPILRSFIRDDFYIHPQMLAAIRAYHQHYTTVLLTNFPPHVHEFMHSVWNVDGTFDHIIASCDVKLLKPDPAMYRYALEKAGCQAEEAVFIDDRAINVEGARSVGMHAIQFLDPQQIVRDLDALLAAD